MSEPPENAKGAAPKNRAQRKTLAKAFDDAGIVKASGCDDLEVITLDESSDFIRLEKVIKHGLDTFVEVGNALAEIRDRRLYRCEYKTFDAYCREKWNIGRTYAHRIMAAAETVEMLPMGNKPTSERQARPLTKIPAEKRVEAWQRAVERADGGQPTAADVEAVVEEVVVVPATVTPRVVIDAAERIWAVAKGHLDKITKGDVSRIKVLQKAITYCRQRLKTEGDSKIDFSDGLACTEIGEACKIKDRAARRNTLLRLAAFAVLNATDQFTPGMILRNVDATAEELKTLADKLDGVARGGAK